jgi:hypothetical protein
MRTIHQFNRWLRPIANTRSKRWVVSVLAVFALLIPLSATSAGAATVTHTSPFTTNIRPDSIRPDSDGGCDQTTSKNSSAEEFCFYITGGGDKVDPMYAYWCNGGPNKVEGHAEITGPDGFDVDGNTYTEGTGGCTPKAPEICPSGCDVPAGTYEGILWQYYDGKYYNVAQQFDVVG